MKKTITLYFLALALSCLTSCGKKGDPIVPTGAPDLFPGQYPKSYE